MTDSPGYEYIPISGPADKREVENIRTHRQQSPDHLSGMLKGVISSITPVHVGTGEFTLARLLSPRPTNAADFELAAAFFRLENHVCVPGSSIKGVFRHLFEMVTRSCFAQADTRPRTGLAVESAMRGCRYRADDRGGRNPIQVCPACRVFGAQGYLGSVYFRHALIEAETEIVRVPSRWTPAVQHADKRKLYSHAKAIADAVEPTEALPSGTHIPLEMEFRNLTPAELGLILMLMGQDASAPLYPKLGALKAFGFGAVEIQITDIQVISAMDYLHFEATSVEDTTSIQRYIEHARQDTELLQSRQWERIQKVLGNRPRSF